MIMHSSKQTLLNSSTRPISIYNTSVTPSYLPWNTYNYCNAPHVNPEYYTPPNGSAAVLVFLAVVMRHHKRTPDNLYPLERTLNPSGGWDCSDIVSHSYAGGTSHVFLEPGTPTTHPFAARVWEGTCDAGQLTRAGLDDAIRHGQDFWGVYHDKLGFLESVSEEEIYVRTSTEPRTHLVAGAMLFGMDPATAGKPRRVYTQPASIDSLVPSYECLAAERLRGTTEATPVWVDHLTHYESLQRRLDETLGTGGLEAWHSWYDHFFDSFTARTCHGHPLPCNASGACVTQKDAETVYAIGDWEYNYIFNSVPQSWDYTRLTFGVFFDELSHIFRNVQIKANLDDATKPKGKRTHKLHLYIGHDGSMIRLASGLGLGRVHGLRWPAMGSEIIMEVWRCAGSQLFVRVLHDGSIAPAPLDWIPLADFVERLEKLVPKDLWDACMAGDVA